MIFNANTNEQKIIIRPVRSRDCTDYLFPLVGYVICISLK